MGTRAGSDEAKMSCAGNCGGVEGGQATAGGDGRIGCGVASDQKTHPPPRIMEEDEGMVHSSGGPFPTARSSYI